MPSIALNMKQYGGHHYGAGKFASILESFLKDNGYEVKTDYGKDDYDIALVFQFLDLDYEANQTRIEHLQRRKIPLIQRIDGPGPRYSPQRKVSISTLEASDITIFQSHYTKNFWLKDMGIKKDHRKYVVIYNGRPVNFTSSEYYENIAYTRNIYKSFSALLNYYGDRKITPNVVINAIPLIVNKWPSFTYDIIGSLKDYREELYNHISNRDLSKYLNVVGYKDGPVLDTIRRYCGICFHLRPNDWCPNSVVEAMSMGIPVIGVKECGTGELVGDAGICISKDAITQPELLEFAYSKIIENHMYYVKQTQKRFVENFEASIVCKQYLDVIKGVLNV